MILPQTPMYLAYPLLSHASLKGDGLPPYLVLEAQRDVTPDIITDIVKFAADRKGSLVAQGKDCFQAGAATAQAADVYPCHPTDTILTAADVHLASFLL